MRMLIRVSVKSASFLFAADSSATFRLITWDPQVMGILSTYDGGKVMAGFGHYSGTIQLGWILKMWGTLGVFACSDDAVISGYVTMTMTTAAAATSECLLKVQYRYASD